MFVSQLFFLGNRAGWLLGSLQPSHNAFSVSKFVVSGSGFMKKSRLPVLRNLWARLIVWFFVNALASQAKEEMKIDQTSKKNTLVPVILTMLCFLLVAIDPVLPDDHKERKHQPKTAYGSAFDKKDHGSVS